MATLEDRLLGEKLEYYCSSSEDEDDDDDGNNSDKEGRDCGSSTKSTILNPGPPPRPSRDDWNGTSTNTGPKGVLQDWQRYKQLQTEQRKDQEIERLGLAKKLAMSCTSHREDERLEKDKIKEEEDDDKLLEDEFFRQYVAKRMEEMVSNVKRKTSYGKVVTLDSADSFLNAIDEEDKSTTVIVHIYDENAAGCTAMNGCLMCLAQEYPYVKFCKFPACAARVTKQFKSSGLPALLVYKAGQLMGNFVRLVDEFGNDFYATDVESFLIEHGMLIDRSLVPSTIRNSSISCVGDDDDDSDFSVDD